ncbi:MAG: hypothetical protein PHF35_04630 [Candidatus Moranbacteria bacterium]|nr:hypothetical protein [Candidatus Moranbacteria bacterium]
MDQDFEKNMEDAEDWNSRRWSWDYCDYADMKWPESMKKQFVMAKMKKGEKILEAKLEFMREIRAMIEKMDAKDIMPAD